MLRWCVVQTKPQKEALAIENLNNQKVKTFFPMLRERVGKEDKLRIMFPKYVFAEIEDDDQVWRSVHYSRGVQRVLLANPEKPSFVPKDFMNALLDGGSIVERFERVVAFTVGQRLEFIDGPFAGQVGVCQWSADKRVALLFDVLGSHRMVISDAIALRAAE